MTAFLKNRLYIVLGSILLVVASSASSILAFRAFLSAAQESKALAELEVAQKLLKDNSLTQEAMYRAGVAVGRSQTPFVLASAAEIVSAGKEFELAEGLLSAAKGIAKESDKPLIEVVEGRIEKLKAIDRQ